MSRTALYSRYVAACEQFEVKPNNAASFGKAIKLQWPDIKVSLCFVLAFSLHAGGVSDPTSERPCRLAVSASVATLGERSSSYASQLPFRSSRTRR